MVVVVISMAVREEWTIDAMGVDERMDEVFLVLFKSGETQKGDLPRGCQTQAFINMHFGPHLATNCCHPPVIQQLLNNHCLNSLGSYIKTYH